MGELKEQVFYCTSHCGYFLRRYVSPESFTGFSRLADCYHCLSPKNRKHLAKLNPYFEEDILLVNQQQAIPIKNPKLKDINSMLLIDNRQEMEALTNGN